MVEKFVTAIQTNRYLNATKFAIIKIAYLNIGVAFALLAYSVGDRLGFVSLSMKLKVPFMITMYMVMMSLIFVYLIMKDLVEEEKGIDVYVPVFVMGLISLNYLDTKSTLLPIIALAIGCIFGVLMPILSRLKFKFQAFPPSVADYLNRLIPILIVLIAVFGLGSYGIELINLLLKPFLWFTGFLDTYFGLALTIASIGGFWILGVHGVSVMGSLLRPFWFYMMLVNAMDIVLGNNATYIASESFYQWAVWLGGSGCTLGLSIGLAYFAKTNELKTLGTDSMKSNIFNINENTLFGVPVVDNPAFKIPFFLAPLLCALVAFFAFSQGYVTTPSLLMPWVLPVPIGIFFATLFDFRSLILSAILIAISFACYYPFLMKYEQSLIEKRRS